LRWPWWSEVGFSYWWKKSADYPHGHPRWQERSSRSGIAGAAILGHLAGVTFLAIEIGGTKLQVCAGTADGGITERQRFAVEREAGGGGIRAQIAGAVPEVMSRWKPRAIGVGYGGPVDWKTGRIRCSHHVAGWNDFPLGDWLREQTGLPVFVENDANVAALGEALHGAGRGASPVFWVNSGSGVGGGLVVDGRLYHGAMPGEMEIGHVRLERDGTIVEDRCSGWAVDRAVRAAVEKEPRSVLARFAAETQPDARSLAPAIAAGCPVADRVLTSAMDELAFALSHVVQLLHPEVIVVGGGLSLIGEPLRDRLAAVLPRWVMAAFAPGPRIALAALKEDAVPVGALALCRTAIESGR
jgi:glucokinase